MAKSPSSVTVYHMLVSLLVAVSQCPLYEVEQVPQDVKVHRPARGTKHCLVTCVDTNRTSMTYNGQYDGEVVSSTPQYVWRKANFRPFDSIPLI